MCYRTTIDECENNTSEYRLYLNRRDLNNLIRNCPNESETLTVIEGENASVSFHSPRYQCRKKNGRLYPYRNKELCLYNISVPDCESGIVSIQHAKDPQELQERLNETSPCRDYLQFHYNNNDSYVRTNPLCGMEILLDPPEFSNIPATNLLAVFWTDGSKNYAGFKLRAACQSESDQRSTQID